MKRFFVAVALLLSALVAVAQDVERTTHTFAQRGEQTLYLDLYASSQADTLQPCLVYVFGGAFLMGSRAEPTVIEVYEYFARRGWKVAAIDYRLGLKPLVDNPEEGWGVLDIRRMLINSVDMATEDVLEATAYMVANAEKLGIDASKIVTLGSSAGAIAVSQAEYAICNDHNKASVLPEGWNYAGVISMAGAIMERGRLRWKQKPCPMMLFHGDADSNVPYDKVSLLGPSLHGSERIYRSLEKMASPCWFYDAPNMDHGYSWRPMFELREEMERFTERMVFGGEPLVVRQVVEDLSLPKCKTNFWLLDYMRSNFAPKTPYNPIEEPIVD